MINKLIRILAIYAITVNIMAMEMKFDHDYILVLGCSRDHHYTHNLYGKLKASPNGDSSFFDQMYHDPLGNQYNPSKDDDNKYYSSYNSRQITKIRYDDEKKEYFFDVDSENKGLTYDEVKKYLLKKINDNPPSDLYDVLDLDDTHESKLFPLLTDPKKTLFVDILDDGADFKRDVLEFGWEKPLLEKGIKTKEVIIEYLGDELCNDGGYIKLPLENTLAGIEKLDANKIILEMRCDNVVLPKIMPNLPDLSEIEERYINYKEIFAKAGDFIKNDRFPLQYLEDIICGELSKSLTPNKEVSYDKEEEKNLAAPNEKKEKKDLDIPKSLTNKEKIKQILARKKQDVSGPIVEEKIKDTHCLQDTRKIIDYFAIKYKKPKFFSDSVNLDIKAIRESQYEEMVLFFEKNFNKFGFIIQDKNLFKIKDYENSFLWGHRVYDVMVLTFLKDSK